MVAIHSFNWYCDGASDDPVKWSAIYSIYFYILRTPMGYVILIEKLLRAEILASNPYSLCSPSCCIPRSPWRRRPYVPHASSLPSGAITQPTEPSVTNTQHLQTPKTAAKAKAKARGCIHVTISQHHKEEEESCHFALSH